MANGNAVTVRAIVKPSSRQRGVTSEGTLLRINVKSPPVEGRANLEAAALIAEAFGVPKNRVELLRGARSTTKHFRRLNPRTAPDDFDAEHRS